MYTQIETDKVATLMNGVEMIPVATLSCESGGRCQITIDDGCYKLSLIQENGRYSSTPYIFPEAFDVLKKLPSLPIQ